jgi:hypothetical protein
MTKCKGIFLLVCVCLLVTPLLQGQTAGTGALTGTISDPSGAVVPNATVTLTNTDTGQVRTTTTGADGLYRFGLLPPGNYRLRIEAGGFKPLDVPAVTVSVTETAVFDRSLEVGGQAQAVTVQGEVETVQTASSAMGTVVNTTTVAALPLSTRNYTSLLAMTAGADANIVNSATLGKSSAVIAVNGGDTTQNTYLQDGVAVNNWLSVNTNAEGTLYGAFPLPDPDSIQEFKIQTSTYDAGYGRNPGANVNVITKSGTNDFHGTAFEFFRNTALNANDFFRNATAGTNGNNGSKLVLNQNQYGGVFGGPIKKDKLFFFVSYQETEQKNGISGFGYSVVTLPPIPNIPRGSCPVGWTSLTQCDAAAQAFVPALGAAICPSLHPGNANDLVKTAGSMQVACNGSNINPIAINLLQLQYNGGYLIPGSTTGNYSLASFTDPALYRNHQGMGNWDYVIDSKNTLSGRYYYETDPTTGPFAANGTSTTASKVLPGNPVFEQKTNHAALLRLTSVLSNNVVNEARISYQRALSTTNELGPYTNSQVGINDITPGINNLTDITVTNEFTVGNNQSFISNVDTNQFQWADQISWTHGKHTFRAGLEVERVQADMSSAGSAIGNPSFQSFPDFLIGLPSCAAFTGVGTCSAANPGNTNGGTQSSVQKFTAATTANGGFPFNGRVNDLSAFVQDDFKLTPRLTINAGLRWEYFGFPSEQYGNFTDIWPSLLNTAPVPGSGCVINGQPFGAGAAGTGCSFAGFIVPSNYQDGPIPSGVYQSTLPYQAAKAAPRDDFAPRLGFAWQPTSSSRFVVRGGAGYFYDRTNGNELMIFPMRNTPGSVPLATTLLSSLASPAGVLPSAVPGPAGSYGFTPRWLDVSTPVPVVCPKPPCSSNLQVNNMTPDLTVPLTYEWNLNTQYEFVHNWVLELGYVGSHGIHQMQPGGGGAPGGGSDPFNWAYLASPTNPINGVTTNTVANVVQRVPNVGVAATANQYQTLSSYLYNALQVTVRKQMSHGIQFQAAYTWNRAFQTIPYGINTFPYEILQMSPSTIYHPQRLIVNYSWNIPSGHLSGIAGKLVSGWSLSGVTTIQDGTPLTLIDSAGGTVFFGTTASGIAPANLCPGATAATAVTSGSLVSRLSDYFNTSAFCPIPSVGGGNGTGYGNVGQGIFRGPGQQNWDASLAKTTRVGGIREDAQLMFRAEFFNAFNHPMFNMPEVLNGSTNPSLDQNNAGFGQITSTAVNPRLIQLALKYSF